MCRLPHLRYRFASSLGNGLVCADLVSVVAEGLTEDGHLATALVSIGGVFVGRIEWDATGAAAVGVDVNSLVVRASSTAVLSGQHADDALVFLLTWQADHPSVRPPLVWMEIGVAVADVAVTVVADIVVVVVDVVVVLVDVVAVATVVDVVVVVVVTGVAVIFVFVVVSVGVVVLLAVP